MKKKTQKFQNMPKIVTTKDPIHINWHDEEEEKEDKVLQAWQDLILEAKHRLKHSRIRLHLSVQLKKVLILLNWGCFGPKLKLLEYTHTHLSLSLSLSLSHSCHVFVSVLWIVFGCSTAQWLYTLRDDAH
jgi:hypothetical protein